MLRKLWCVAFGHRLPFKYQRTEDFEWIFCTRCGQVKDSGPALPREKEYDD